VKEYIYSFQFFVDAPLSAGTFAAAPSIQAKMASKKKQRQISDFFQSNVVSKKKRKTNGMDWTTLTEDGKDENNNDDTASEPTLHAANPVNPANPVIPGTA